jgi:AcrR family transcriptional regulator
MSSLRHIGRPEPTASDLYLDAARACILDVGWRRTTLTEVARRAGVSRMTIYRSWSDMPQLLGDLMTREWGGVVAVAARGPEESGPEEFGTVGRIVGTATRAIRALRENELFVRIVELDPQLLLPYLLSRRGRSQQAILDLVADQLRAGQALGEVRDTDPDVLARAMLLATHGFVLSAHTMVDDLASEDALDAELAEILTRAVRP